MSLNYSEWDYYVPSYEGAEVTFKPDLSREIQLVIAAIITCLGILANGIVLLLMVCRLETRTLPFLTVSLLALCDFVRNSSAILLIIGQALNNWIFGDAVCKVTRYLHFCSAITSSLHLVLAIITRYCAVFRESSYLVKLRFDRMMLFSLLAWLLVIVGSVPVVITYSAWEVPYSDPKVAACIFQADMDKSRGLIISDAVVRFLVPLLALLVVAVLTILQGCGPSPAVVRCCKAVIITTPVLFTCLHLPFQACSVWMSSAFVFDQNVVRLQQYADSLSYTSTVFNPLLQAFTSPEFKGFLSSFRCCAKRYDASKAEKRAQRIQNKVKEQPKNNV